MKKSVILTVTTLLCSSLFITGCQEDTTLDEISTSMVQDTKQSAETAQTIMIDFGTTDFSIEGNQIWKFDQEEAARVEGVSKEELKVQQVRCDFWNDGRKYWYIHQDKTSGESSSQVDANITIAGLSWMTNKQFPLPLGKYSFTLDNPDGTSRIEKLEYSINGGTTWLPLSHVIEYGNTTNNCLLEQKYFPTATFGSFPTFTTFPNTMGVILATDGEPKNDMGCGTTAIGKAQITFPGVGTYNVEIRGTVKGNSGQSATTFKTGASFKIVADNCEKK
jgi:hypothetical protein